MNMEQGDDDSIIFENSPLHRYLNEIGCESETTERVKNNSNEKVEGAKSELLQNVRKRLSETINRTGAFLKSEIDQTDLDCGNILLNNVFASNLLEHDDEILLKTLLKTPAERVSSGTYNYVKIISSTLLVVLMSWIMKEFINLSSFTFTTFLFLFLSTFLSIISLVLLLSPKYRQICWKKRINEIDSFLAVENTLDIELKKLLAHIREREIINSGYTIVSRYAAIPKFASGKELPCANVRKVVLKCLLQLFNQYRVVVNDFLKNRNNTNSSRGIEIVTDEFFLAQVDEKEFIGFLNSDDCVSISALKACCQYFSLQRSEFLRLWLLRGCSLLFVVSDAGNRFENGRSVFISSIKTLTKNSKDILKTLQTTQKLCSPQTLDVENVPRRNVVTNKMSDVAEIIHSLRLHLQIAFEKAASFPTEESENFNETVESFLPLLETDIKAALNCVDEIRDKCSRKNNPAEGTAIEPYQKMAQQHDSQREVKVVDDDYELIIEDQVYEAETLDDEDMARVDGNHQHDVECEKSTIPRRNLLDELKSVLFVRSSAMYEREIRALAARRGVPLEDLIKEEKAAATADQSKATSVELRFNRAVGDKLASSNSSTVTTMFSRRKSSDEVDENGSNPPNVFSKNLADELRRALLARSAVSGKNYDEQIGDDDEDEDGDDSRKREN